MASDHVGTIGGRPAGFGRVREAYVMVLLVFVEGPAATLVAATMAASGILRADLVFIFSVTANFLADVFWYLVGFSAGHGGRVSRLAWLRRRMEQIESMETALHGRATQMYLLTKLSLGLLTIPVLIASGLARVLAAAVCRQRRGRTIVERAARAGRLPPGRLSGAHGARAARDRHRRQRTRFRSAPPPLSPHVCTPFPDDQGRRQAAH